MAKTSASTQRSLAFLSVAALVLCGSAAWFLWPRASRVGSPPSPAIATSAAEGVASAAPARSADKPTTPELDASKHAEPLAAAPRAASTLDEATVMTQLRALRAESPNLALKLARDANDRFGASADAAERSWIIVKALTDLGRHEEARAEGRLLVERYRGTSWAEDAYRHLFVNPPTHPFERGYGKTLESDP